MLALGCQYICHVLYFELCNNIQLKIKCELSTLTEPNIVMSPKIIVKPDPPKILHNSHQQLLSCAPIKSSILSSHSMDLNMVAFKAWKT